MPCTRRPLQENPPVLGVAEPLREPSALEVQVMSQLTFLPSPPRVCQKGRISLWMGQSPALALALELCRTPVPQLMGIF